MAKTGFWLRGARGKFAGAVLAKGADGQTIQRELVKPKNPRTNGQMAQRMIFATVASAYSQMKAICDHSFEGVQYGAKTQQAFFKEALTLMRTRAAADDGNFLIPNVSALMANPYVISRGSLTSPKNIAYDGGDDFVHISNMVNPTVDESVVVTTKSFCNALGINKGDQITLVAIVRDGDQPVLGEYAGREYRRNKFVYARITVKADAADDEIVYSTTGASWGTAVIIDGIGENSFYIEDIAAGNMIFNHPGEMLAFGCIRSAKEGNIWLRSNESLTLAEEMLVYNFSDMLPAWTSTGTELLFDSTRYLNNAEAENVVNTPALTRVAARVSSQGGEITVDQVAALSKGPYEGTPIVDNGDNKHPYGLKDNGHVYSLATFTLVDGYITKETAEKQLGTALIVDQN